MDPASLGLGAASLVFQLFSGCVKGYELLAMAAGMPKAYEYLMLRLKFEQHTLLDWSLVVGLVDENGPKLSTYLRLNRTLLIDILHQTRTLLEEFGKLNGRYHELLPERDAVEDNQIFPGGKTIQGEVLDAPVEKPSHFPRRRKALKMALDAIEKVPSAPKRLRWATFDKEKFEMLLDKLGKLNGFMRGLMDENQNTKLLETQHQTYLEILQLHNTVHDLQQLVRALGSAGTRTKRIDVAETFVTGTAEDLDVRQREEEQKIAELAKFKEVNADIENLVATAETELHRKNIEFDSPEDHEATDQRPEASLLSENGRTTRVWVEWKDYEPIQGDVEQKPDQKIVDRVRQLTALLSRVDKPEAFRVPRCLGYFDDCDPARKDPTGRFGFVFEKPKDVDPSTQPISLLELFSVHKPSLTDRIALAGQVSNCILYLHSVNWLHKGLRSHNIIFFPDADKLDYHRPYLSGFDYARPSRPDEMTEKPPQNPEFDVYRHPNAHGDGPKEPMETRNPFKKSYDIYSLGVILLEIALWRSIDAIVGIDDLRTARPPETRRIREMLLKEKSFLGSVGADAGNLYRDIVDVCLQGAEGFGLPGNAVETDELVAAELQQAFTEKVIEKLAAMKL